MEYTCSSSNLLSGRSELLAPASASLGVLTPNPVAPVVAKTAVIANLLQALQVIAHLSVNAVGHNLAEAAILVVLLPVQEPVGDTELTGVADDHHQRLELLGSELSGALGKIDLSLLAHKVGETTADTLDLSDGWNEKKSGNRRQTNDAERATLLKGVA